MLPWRETFPNQTMGVIMSGHLLPHLVTLPQPLLISINGWLCPGYIARNKDTPRYDITICNMTRTYAEDESIEPRTLVIMTELETHRVSRDGMECQVVNRSLQPIGTVKEVLVRQKESASKWLEFITAWDPKHLATRLASYITLPRLKGADSVRNDLRNITVQSYIEAFMKLTITTQQMRDIIEGNENLRLYIIERMPPHSKIADMLICERIGMWRRVPKDVIRLICSYLTPEYYTN